MFFDIFCFGFGRFGVDSLSAVAVAVAVAGVV